MVVCRRNLLRKFTLEFSTEPYFKVFFHFFMMELAPELALNCNQKRPVGKPFVGAVSGFSAREKIT